VRPQLTQDTVRTDASPMTTSARDATRQRAARDVLLQVVTRILNLLLGVFVTALVARTLGKNLYGQWTTIFVVLTLVGFLANFGMEKVVVREAAAHPEREEEWLGAFTLVRLYIVGPVVVLSLLALLALHRSDQMLAAGAILTISMPFEGVGVLSLVFQLRVKNLVPMLVLTLRSLLWAGAVAFIHWHGGGMVALAVAMTASNLAGTAFQTVAALKILPRWPRPSRNQVRRLLSVGIPLGVSGVMVIAYARIDQVIVYSISGSSASGLYGAVYGIIDQAHFLPMSVLTTLTPIIAASWATDKERMLQVVAVAAELLSIASLGILAFAIAAAPPLVRAVFGPSYVSGSNAMPVLAGAFVFICFGYLNGSLLTVMGLQQRLMRISVLALVVNVAGNLILVPLSGYMGAAWMTLITELVVFAASLNVIRGGLGAPLPSLAKVGRALVAAVLLTGVVALVRAAGASLGVLVLATGVVYPALLFGLRALSLDDVRLVLKRA
jgi:O-antigen/teichoic acid export membrane protein